MDIFHFLALEQLYRQRRRYRQKVFVTADINGTNREGKIIREREGRWLIEFFATEENGHIERTVRRYLSIDEFNIHPVDQQQFEQHILALYGSYDDLDIEP